MHHISFSGEKYICAGSTDNEMTHSYEGKKRIDQLSVTLSTDFENIRQQLGRSDFYRVSRGMGRCCCIRIHFRGDEETQRERKHSKSHQARKVFFEPKLSSQTLQTEGTGRGFRTMSIYEDTLFSPHPSPLESISANKYIRRSSLPTGKAPRSSAFVLASKSSVRSLCARCSGTEKSDFRRAAQLPWEGRAKSVGRQRKPIRPENSGSSQAELAGRSLRRERRSPTAEVIVRVQALVAWQFFRQAIFGSSF